MSEINEKAQRIINDGWLNDVPRERLSTRPILRFNSPAEVSVSDCYSVVNGTGSASFEYEEVGISEQDLVDAIAIRDQRLKACDEARMVRIPRCPSGPSWMLDVAGDQREGFSPDLSERVVRGSP